ncbi:MAG: hypothetical protein ACLFN5_04845 [bacterium]
MSCFLTSRVRQLRKKIQVVGFEEDFAANFQGFPLKIVTEYGH